MARYNKDNLLLLPVHARVEEMEITEGDVQTAIAAALEKQGGITAAALSPVGPNGRPRMLQLVAWMCHAPAPNSNNEAFRPQDLERLVRDGLFTSPYFGIFDENHDLSPRGTIYSAEWAYDEAAKEYGLLIKAAIWAHRFPDFVDKLLRQQEELGHVNVSMMCLFLESEQKVWSDGRTYREIHDPVFIACSAITDGQPGDANANGLTFLDGDWWDSEQVADMLKRSFANEAENPEEVDMKELIAKIEGLLADQKAELTPLVEAVARLASVETELSTATAAVTAAATKVTELEQSVATLTTEKATLTSANEGLVTEANTAKAALEGAQTTVAALTTEVETLRSFKAEVDTKQVEAARAARVTARTAEIPQVVMASLDLEKNDADKTLYNEWMDMPEEKWATDKRLLAMASGRKSHAERSSLEGLLSGNTDRAEGDYAIDAFRNKGGKK
jgi:FtsZ-binding cell division protein ZapB